MSAASCSMPNPVSYIDAAVAKTIDEKLMAEPGFSIDQLMELAGYSVAAAMHDFHSTRSPSAGRSLLVLCGPGNNGGDGLVAARHLQHFGYSPKVVYPKPSTGRLFDNLVQQVRDLGIPLTAQPPTQEEMDSADGVIDAIFGFSFHGAPRQPFSGIIDMLTVTSAPVLAVDVPSGWSIDDSHAEHPYTPQAVISLTLPKRCMQGFAGVHYVGGRYSTLIHPLSHFPVTNLISIVRFMPASLAAEWNLTLPDYGLGPAQFVRLPSAHVLTSPSTTVSSEDQLVAMFVTASSQEEAHALANTLVSEQLAACVNMLPGVQSVYQWEGRVESSQEVMLMIKVSFSYVACLSYFISMQTRKVLADAVTQRVKQLQSYEVPESIVLDIQDTGSNPDYLNWVRGNTAVTLAKIMHPKAP